MGTVSKAGSTSKLLDASGFDGGHVFDGRAVSMLFKKWRCLNIPSQLGSRGLKMRVFVKDSLLLLVFGMCGEMFC